MENNFICSWLFHYAQSNFKYQNLDLLIDVESNYQLKSQLTSAAPYIACGNNLNFKFPPNAADFTAIFHYLTRHKGRVIDKLKDEEKQSYINSLTNCDNFSMKHHIAIIKCFMKAYVCELAPVMRVRRAFVAMGFSNSIDLDDDTFKTIQKHLPIWLRTAAVKGLQKLVQKSYKMLTESELTKFISVSTLTSQLVYCMFFYAQTKMIQFIITVPDLNVILQKEPLSKDLISSHVTVVLKAFSEICDNQDVFPIETDKLSSLTMDSVQATLTIALVFHWIFGNSLKTLENLLKMSSSCSSLQQPSKPQPRPTSIFVTSSSEKSDESKPNNTFYMPTRSPGSESLSQIFSSKKAARENNLLEKINKENTLSPDGGDTSPDIFLTPTEDVPVTFSNPATPSTKLLVHKPILNKSSKSLLGKDENQTPMTISLKSEFQKKQQLKLHNPKSKVTVMSTNETTWLAQKNKNETNQIPLTPKKTTARSFESPTRTDSKNLSKAQLNELQIQFGLQRQKIQKNKQMSAEKTGKFLENSKQKVFFQVINKKALPLRRSSLESEDSKSQNNSRHLDNRLSLILPNEILDNNDATFLYEINNSENNVEINDNTQTNGNYKLPDLIEKHPEKADIEENNNEMELPQSLQESDVALTPAQIIQEQTIEIPVESKADYYDMHSSVLPSNLPNISEVSFMEEAPVSRKNSSNSISSLSSNKSSDKIFNQQDYYKSFNMLNQSITSLQEEVRFLTKQQSSWNKQVVAIAPTILLETTAEANPISKDNSSVLDTPTNNIVSLTEISDDLKLQEDLSPSMSEPCDNDPKFPMITDVNLLQHSISQPDKTDSKILTELNPPETKSLNQLDDLNDVNVNFVRVRTRENKNDFKEKEFGMNYREYNNNNNNNISEENNNIPIEKTFSNSISDEDISSNESLEISNSNVQPITFVIESTDQEVEEAQQRKAEILARREEKRRLKIELSKQKRDEERENRLSATIDELMEREEKKRLEKEKRDSLLQKYLDRKKGGQNSRVAFGDNSGLEKRSSSTANTPVKLCVNSKTTPRLVAASGKQDSVGNIPLASSHKSTWFSSMRISNKKTSQSTSILNDDMAIGDSTKFGVPLPPQEYTGPKLFGKRKVKTNRSVIVNAISHCCLAGSVNETLKESVLRELAEAEGTHFMILFRDARCQYRATYSFNLASDDLILVCGSGPRRISHEMVEKFYKYNSGAKQFNLIISTKHLSPAVDAICIQSLYWNPRPGNQLSQNSVSTTNIDQPKPKRNPKTVSNLK